MKVIKSIIPALLILILVFSAISPAFAEIAVELEPKTNLQVGDTVTITVTASNDDLFDWYPVVVSAPIPNGLEYTSHVVPDKVMQNYDPGSGIWNVNRMRHDERGHLKTLVITCKVLPSAAGERITATARFQQVCIELNGRDITADQAPARSDLSDPVPVIAPVASFRATPLTGNAPLTVYFTDTSSNSPTSWFWDFGDGTSTDQNPTHTYSKSGTYTITLTASNSGGQSSKTIFITVDDPDPGTGPGEDGGNGTGSGGGNGSNFGLGAAAGLLNQQSGGGGGNGKAYEVFEDTPKSEIYYGLAIILIAAVILFGYLYGNKRKQ